MQIDRKLVGIEQRHRPAHDLLGAAERIAVERCKQARNVERGRWRHRQREAPAGLHVQRLPPLRQVGPGGFGEAAQEHAGQHL
jgi:hypothetical protein